MVCKSLKICKVRDPENIAALSALGPLYLGFDFRPTSSHYIGEIDEALLSTLPPTIRKVGLFDSEEALYITYIAGRFSLSAVQIEGDVPPSTCEILAAEGLEIFKVVKSASDIDKYEGVCNRFLIRDQEILRGYSSPTPLIVDKKIWRSGSGHIVDIADDFEVSVALKDVEEIENFRRDNL